MYWPEALTAAQRRLYTAALASSHSIRVQVSVMTLDGTRISHLTPQIVDGQVNVDVSTPDAVTRSATLQVFDPFRKMPLDSSSPGDGALYMDRQLRIRYGVKVAGVGWVDVPVITGPVSFVERNGSTLTIDVMGRDVMAMGALWKPLTIRKGVKKTEAIKAILRRCGETSFLFPEVDEKLPKHLSLGRETVPWSAAQKIARSLNRQLYYDGSGTCLLRKLPENPLFTFREGYGGTIVDSPVAGFDSTGVRNVVLVKGGQPKGTEKNPANDDVPTTGGQHKSPGIRGSAVAPRHHPLSPWSLGGNSMPRYLLDVVDDSHIRGKAAADRLAKQRLRDHLRQELSLDWTALPVPHLDELDWVRVKTDQFARGVRLKRFSIPLTTGGVMTLGRNAKVSVTRRGRRR